MNKYLILKEQINKISQDMKSLAENAKKIHGFSERAFLSWEKATLSIEKQMFENIVRVAVVGSIKSGKSTFTNSLFKGDYLKRGAGVVTSIVTRIRSGAGLSATLDFKTWDDVNSEMRNSVVLFPSLKMESFDGSFDIRLEKHRQMVQDALKSLKTEQLIKNDARDLNCMILDSYIKGYPYVKDIVSDHPINVVYRDKDFPEHKAFVGDQNRAVYLKDIELQMITYDNDGSNIEFADCQGVDSPNPLHLTMIQDYLLKTNLIVYVISSRTGLRQSDIRFLNIIKEMGISDNILFVINCDLSEHTGLDDMLSVIERIKEEISIMKTLPDVFTFSALLNLFEYTKQSLPEKDIQRLNQWKSEKELSKYSSDETKRFNEFFFSKFAQERYNLLLRNNLQRLTIMLFDLNDQVQIQKDLLSKDHDSAEKMIQTINRKHKVMDNIKTMVRNTLDGSIRKIKTELERNVDRFFDIKYGDTMKDLISFIRNYSISLQHYESDLSERGFSTTVYKAYQEFKTALDTYMAETINPRLIKFIFEEEKKMGAFLNQVTISYDDMVKESIKDYGHAVKDLGIALRDQSIMSLHPEDMNIIKNDLKLSTPTLLATLRYNTRIKSEAIMSFGFYSMTKFFKKLFKKSLQSERENGLMALKRSVKSMKKETEKSVLEHFVDFRENLKFQYVFKLVEAASGNIYDRLMERFQLVSSDLSDMVDMTGKNQEEKNNTIELLTEIEKQSQSIIKHIERVKAELESSVQK